VLSPKTSTPLVLFRYAGRVPRATGINRFKASVEIVIRPLSNSTAILRLAKMREFSCEQACPQTLEARCDQISSPP